MGTKFYQLTFLCLSTRNLSKNKENWLTFDNCLIISDNYFMNIVKIYDNLIDIPWIFFFFLLHINI